MRMGFSPLKRSDPIEGAAEVSVCLLNAIPDTEGYFAQALDVLKLTLASIRHHADREFDLLIVDNGSCRTVVEYLQAELMAGRIDYLILNRRNIGAGNGRVGGVLPAVRSALGGGFPAPPFRLRSGFTVPP